MMQQNAARTIDSSPQRGGIHLVYSQEWSPARRQVAAARLRGERRMTSGRFRAAQHGRSHGVRLALGAAALSGPLVWAGHALLHWANLL